MTTPFVNPYRFGAPAWTPASFPSLTGWWSMKDLVGQSDGTDITAFNDKSGAGRNWSSIPSIALPDKETRSTYPVMECLGAEAMRLNAITLGTVVGTTGLVAAVAEMAATPASTNSAFYNNNGVISELGGYWGLVANNDAAVNWRFGIFDSASRQVDIAASVTTRYVLVGRCDGVNLYLSVDGGTESSTACTGPSSTTGVMNLGRAGYSTTYFNGWIYEVVTSTANGTSGDRASLIAYLKAQWGIA